MEDFKNNDNLLNSAISLYNLKKSSVLILFCKMLYLVFILILFGYGVYFIYLSGQKELVKDRTDFDKISSAWNQTYRNDIAEWRVYLKNENNFTVKLDKDIKKMHDYDDKDEIFYNPLQYMTYNIKLFEKIKFNKVYLESTSNTYNLTTNLTMIIDDGLSVKNILVPNIDVFIRNPNKMNHNDCIKSKGLWNYEDYRCYKFYVLRSLCIIVDQEIDQEKDLYFDYKIFKCNGFYNWYESHSVIEWFVPSYDPIFDDITKNIKIYVSTNKDPYVWANYNGTLHYDHKIAENYNVAGVWLIISSLCLIAFPIVNMLRGKYTETENFELDDTEESNLNSAVKEKLKMVGPK